MKIELFMKFCCLRFSSRICLENGRDLPGEVKQFVMNKLFNYSYYFRVCRVRKRNWIAWKHFGERAVYAQHDKYQIRLHYMKDQPESFKYFLWVVFPWKIKLNFKEYDFWTLSTSESCIELPLNTSHHENSKIFFSNNLLLHII